VRGQDEWPCLLWFDVLKELSAAGGGEDMDEVAADSQNLNPFARKVKKPVVYWSGIVDVDAYTQSKQFTIPDHFDGTLRVMAVAVSDNQFAHAQEKVVVRGPFIVTPNVPLVVAPGDEFEVTVGVSNQLEDSGQDVPIVVNLDLSEHVQVLGEATETVQISEGNETSLRFKLKATERLGSADIDFSASSDAHNASRKANTSMSIRPAMPKNLSLKSGRFKEGEKVLELKRELLADYAEAKIQISNNPTLLIDGLTSYLSVYPHACTEQIVSQVMPLVAFAKHPNYLGSPSDKANKLNTLFSSLQQRQLSNGGFSLWPSGNEPARIPSVHTMHLLLEAKDEGLQVPPYLVTNGIEYLAAYAIYLLTASGEVTGGPLAKLETILNERKQNNPKNAYYNWEQQLVGAYIRDAMAMYLLAKHFPNEFNSSDTSRIEALIEPVLSGNINTMSSGRTLMALNAYAKLFDGDDITQSIKVAVNKINEETWKDIQLNKDSSDALYASAELDFDSSKLRVQNLNAVQLYYQTLQNGYDRTPPTTATSNGLEVEKRFVDTKTEKEKKEFVQGDDVIVVLRIRSTDNASYSDIAMIDLVPGGFEIDIEESRKMSNRFADYIDIREDRFVFYGRVNAGDPLIVAYKARVSTSGEFIVPPVYANAMYDEKITAHSAASKVSVAAGK